MKIYPYTKISELVKADQAAIEAIASLAKPLEKLRNPLLRRVMASRVTLAQAAIMGGCELEKFVGALSALGFEYVEEDQDGTQEKGKKKENSKEKIAKENTLKPQAKRPEWLSIGVNDHFDVRPIIASGQDPLKEILKRYKDLKPGDVLCVENSFVPYPLIHLLEGKNAKTHIETEHAQLHWTYFYKPKSPTSTLSDLTNSTSATSTSMANPAQVVFHEEASYKRLLEQCDTIKWKEIDVRHLEMPEPMHTILAELEELPEQQALYIKHKRVPVFLLEALEDQPFDIHIHEVSEGDTQLLIMRHQKGEK